jgi:N-methylhydantoinase A
MPWPDIAQTTGGAPLLVGVDVGGTFTDLVAFDGSSLRIVKVPSTPPAYERGVIEAIADLKSQISDFKSAIQLVHGSTVATNALLQRAGEPIAFVTTEGFRDMLLIGRQNRPKLYALHVRPPQPIAPPENCFTVHERLSASGEVVTPLDDAQIDRVITEIQARGLRHVAVCLLFSFVNPAHERRIGERCAAAGLTASLSSDLLPEFREYERASTVAINAALRPTVKVYLESLESRLAATDLRIMHSGGGTLNVADAQAQAARLVLSGPAGGVLGAAFVAGAVGFTEVITYDMGGTSTDVAVIRNGLPQWTTATTIDGLPIALPMFDIHTVGAGGGSVAFVDTGGALRVGPRSAGAHPGPACYGRGGTEPTVTDANLLLGRIVPDRFLGGAMRVDIDLARIAMARLAERIGKDPIQTALGIVKVAEASMEAAIRAVTSQRGHDPRDFTLVSFGGAGGLHAAALADALDIPRVLIPPCCGVLSALGMVVAPPVVDASRTVLQLSETLDDERLVAEYGRLSGETIDKISYDQTAATEVFADVRFRGQSYELNVRVLRPSLDHIREQFLAAYRARYGHVPEGREIEVVTLRVRRIGKAADITLPAVASGAGEIGEVQVIGADGLAIRAKCADRAGLLRAGTIEGPMLLVDAQATAFVPNSWSAAAAEDGGVVMRRTDSAG